MAPDLPLLQTGGNRTPWFPCALFPASWWGTAVAGWLRVPHKSARRAAGVAHQWPVAAGFYGTAGRERPDRTAPGFVPATTARRRPTPARCVPPVTADCLLTAAPRPDAFPEKSLLWRRVTAPQTPARHCRRRHPARAHLRHQTAAS